ncbi:MAG: hypothetical protein DRN08_03070 [Thermoplasmata archaeon]|nr:MAG: hypothetical protein DRN08_03070 [Thermoplasmata archaeon]
MNNASYDFEEGGHYEKQDRYHGFINYESILMQQLNRIAKYRSDKKIELYEQSVDTLIYMLPQDMREKAMEYKKKHDIRYEITQQGIQKYDDLWRYCNELLENANLIFKQSYIKTYF